MCVFLFRDVAWWVGWLIASVLVVVLVLVALDGGSLESKRFNESKTSAINAFGATFSIIGPKGCTQACP